MDYKTARGWLRIDEREHLVDLAREVPPDGMIINIGVEHGASMVCFRSGNPLCNIIGLDVDLTKLTKEVYEWVKCLLVDGDSHDNTVIQRVDSLVGAFGNRKLQSMVDLLFIDGDHSYDGVLKDAYAYGPMVGVGGNIVFHDCFDFDNPVRGQPNPNAPDVNRAVTEWRHNSRDWVDLGIIGTMRIFKKV